jgi:hypothetical protein
LNGEAILVTSLGLALGGLIVREVICFLRWRRSLSEPGLSEPGLGDQARVIRTLRNR